MGFHDASPLSEFLSPLEGQQSKRMSKTTQKLIVAAVVALFVPSLNATFASDISLGSDEIEFGQGSNTASACDSTINVEVNSAWSDDDEFFEVTDLTLTGIDTEACLSKTITVSAYDASNSKIDLNSGSSGSLSYVVTSNIGPNGTGELIPTNAINSESIAKLIVETN